ncbi:MAG TPA: 4Fe-4S binding protein [Azospirillaceae bacterium]|nr:4Fe-4S binding protein [Azospirillaceae bacterium]
MAMTIDADSCTACGACEAECPTNSISMKKSAYAIDAASCTECAGAAKKPKCAAVCPSDCITKA